jgi:hypothetical protein
MAKFTLEDTIKTFNYQQAAVVYWFCQGFSNYDIASMLQYEVSSVVWRFSQVYKKLGLDRQDSEGNKLHSTERRRILREKVCPIIKRLTNDNPDLLELFPLIPPNVLEGSILDLRPDIPVPPSEPFVPPPEPPSEPPPLPPEGEIPPLEPPPDFYPIELYNAWLAVLEDDRNENPPPPPPPIIIRPDRRGRRSERPIGLVLAILIGCAVVGVLGYLFGTRQIPPPPESPIPSAPDHIPFTQTATITLTIPPSETATSTASPTLTVTITPIPTDTKSPLDLHVGDVLENGSVSLRLTKVGYNEKYDKTGAKVAPISYYFDFTNHSGETKVLRFDQYYFENTDDRGQTTNCWFYHISGAGPAVNELLANGATRQIIARCGDGQLDLAVKKFVLTVHPFSSLAESKWTVEIPH